MQLMNSDEGPMTFNPYSLTQILYFNGTITEWQARRIKKIQSIRQNKGGSTFSGQIALELGYITEEQLDDAIAEKDRFCIRDKCQTSSALRQVRLDLMEVLK